MLEHLRPSLRFGLECLDAMHCVQLWQAGEVRQRDLVRLHFLSAAELITLLTRLLIWH